MASIDIAYEKFIFLILIWVEASSTYPKNDESNLVERGERNKGFFRGAKSSKIFRLIWPQQDDGEERSQSNSKYKAKRGLFGDKVHVSVEPTKSLSQQSSIGPSL